MKRIINESLLAVAAGILLLATLPARAGEPPSIAGSWVLDAKLSDKSPQVVPNGNDKGRGEEPRRWGHHGPDDGGPPGGGGISDAARGFQEIFSATRLNITQQEPEVDVVYDGHRLRRIFTDGRGTVATASGSVRPELGPSIAGWDKGVLVVETTPEMDTHVVERIKPSPDGRTLTIKTSIDHIGMKKPAEFKRVFVNPDRPPPAAATGTQDKKQE